MFIRKFKMIKRFFMADNYAIEVCVVFELGDDFETEAVDVEGEQG